MSGKGQVCQTDSFEGYRLIFDNAREGIAVIQDGRIVLCNPWLTEISGYTADELKQNSIQAFIHPDHQALVEGYHKARLAGGDVPTRYSFKGVSKDGRILWIEVSGVRIEWDGRPASLNFFTDITERKQNEELLQSTLDATNDGIWDYNLASGEFNHSDRWAEMLGYEPGEVKDMGCFCEANVHAEDKPAFLKAFHEYLAGEASSYGIEFRLRTKSGDYKWLYSRGRIVERGPDGAPRRIIGAHTDISERKRDEEKARESEIRLRSMFEHMGSGVAVYEPVDGGNDFIFQDINPAGEAITHLKREEVLGRRLLDLFPNMDKSGLMAALRRVWKTGEYEHLPPFHYQDQIREGWRENRLYKLPSGEVVAIFDDVTERVEGEQAQARSEERLNLALDAVSDAVWDWRVDTGEIYFSSRWFGMLGYEPEAQTGTVDNWQALLHPDDLASVQEHIREHLKTGDPFEIEFRMRTSDGGWKWILGRGKTVERDAAGAPVRMLGTHMDITERKCMEAQLQDALDRLNYHVTNSPLAVVEWKAGTHINQWSRQAEIIFGWSAEEVVGKNWDDFPFIHPEDATGVAQTLAPLFDGTQRFNTCSNRNYRKDGSIIHCQWYNSALMDGQGRMVSILSQVADVTELKEAKIKAEAASQAKSEFLANMSHEIRTPLNGVMGMLQLVQSTQLNAEQHEFIDTAVQAGNRLTRLLTDILDISRVEAGRMALVTEPFDLGEVMDSIDKLFTPSTLQKGIDFQVSADGAKGLKLLGDGHRLQQVLNNLVGNAIKFTEEGSVTLKAWPLEMESEENGRVLFMAADTGIGIPDEKLAYLFEPFNQVESAFTRRFQGAGLGLAIARDLVALMGGELCVDSQEGRGTNVYCLVPLRAAERQGPREHAAEKATREAPGALRVLVVEDDWVNRLTMERILEHVGCDVTVAENGAEALEQFSTHEFDVVFMDIQMPVMDGVEAIRAIRSGVVGRKAAALPIVALTAFAMEGDKESFFAAGADDYMAKPVDLPILKKKLERVAKVRRSS